MDDPFGNRIELHPAVAIDGPPVRPSRASGQWRGGCTRSRRRPSEDRPAPSGRIPVQVDRGSGRCLRIGLHGPRSQLATPPLRCRTPVRPGWVERRHRVLWEHTSELASATEGSSGRARGKRRRPGRPPRPADRKEGAPWPAMSAGRPTAWCSRCGSPRTGGPVEVADGEIVGLGFAPFLDGHARILWSRTGRAPVLPGVFCTRVAGVPFHDDVAQLPHFSAGRRRRDPGRAGQRP